MDEAFGCCGVVFGGLLMLLAIAVIVHLHPYGVRLF